MSAPAISAAGAAKTSDTYESRIRPILDAASAMGAHDVLFAGGAAVHIAAVGRLVKLDETEPVPSAELEVLLKSVGMQLPAAGFLGPTIRFDAHRSADGKVHLAFRHFQDIPRSMTAANTGSIGESPASNLRS